MQPIRGEFYNVALVILSVADRCVADTERPGRRTRTTTEMIPEDILLEIFDFYRLNAMKRTNGWPWKWHRLAHVCRKWRLVISLSPRRLDLQIHCKYGATIERILASWGTLPLFVRFNGGPNSKLLPKNITTALRHPDRVREINLSLTSTTVGLVVDAMKKPFQILERIRIKIKGTKGPSLPFRDVFLGGSAPRLRLISLDGINFPFLEIKQIISSTNNLVELCLSRIPKTGYFSADALITALSTSAQLKRLQVSFHYPASLSTQSKTNRPLQRTTFPSLRYLKFHGASEYLEEFLSRVDLPSLRNMDIKFFNQIFFEIPEFCRSVPPLNPFRSLNEVVINLGDTGVSMDFKGVTKHGTRSGGCYLNCFCERLDWQLSFMTQVSSQLSPLLKSVDKLFVIVFRDKMPSGEEDVDSIQWLELLQPFTRVRKLCVCGDDQFVRDIGQALVTEEMATEVLLELTQFSVLGRHEPAVVEAVKQFVAARKLSGRTIHFSM